MITPSSSPPSSAVERAPTIDEFALGMRALRRARDRAEDVALATGTELVFFIDGKVTRVTPRPRSERGGNLDHQPRAR